MHRVGIDDGGGGLGPPVVAEAVLEVPLDALLGGLVDVLGCGEGDLAPREVEAARLCDCTVIRYKHCHCSACGLEGVHTTFWLQNDIGTSRFAE